MKKFSLHHSLALLSLPLLLAACSQGPVGGSPSATAPKPAPQRPLLSTSDVSTSSTRWILQLQADPTESSAETVKREQDAFRAAAAAAKIEYQELHTYSKLLNGFTIKATESEIRRLRNLPGVTQVSPVTYFTAPVLDKNTKNEDQNIAEMFYARGMTGVTQAAKELGLTGKGVKVGVIDSGIEKDHPAFKGRIVSAVDIVGDDYEREGDPLSPDPIYPFPEDCLSHGTHVAGIIGGDDPKEIHDGVPFSGVAPGVQFGIYRVFGCSGGSSDEAMIRGMEQALADGMQVVNLSIGSPLYNWAQSPDAIAANRLVKRGVVVVASAGNSGRNGQYSMGGVTMGENVISVASVDNASIEKGTIVVNNDPNMRFAFDDVAGSPPVTKGLSFELIKSDKSQLNTAKVKNTYGDDDNKYGCFEYAKDALKGKAVLISRGKPENMPQGEDCTFFVKAYNAQKAGAVGVVFYNNQPGPIENVGVIRKGGSIRIPLVAISDTDGAQILTLLNTQQSVNISADGVTKPFPHVNAGRMSDFSSYGMSAELEFKPDIAAPGGSIFSSVPHHLSGETGYDIKGGTSMASPHVAGIVALLLEADPTLKAKDVRTLLMNTASLRQYSDSKDKNSSDVDFVERQGAGLINIMNAYKALKQTPVSVYPPKLSLKDSGRYPVAHKVLTLRNDSNQDLEYTIKHVPALTVGGDTYDIQPLKVYAFMKINGQAVDSDVLKVTVPAGGETELNLEVTAPTGAPDYSQYGGYVQLESVKGPNLSVPYGGLTGNYLKKAAFGTILSSGFSRKTPILLDSLEGAEIDNGESIESAYSHDPKYGPDYIPDYTFRTYKTKFGVINDSPKLQVNLAHQVRKLTLELVEIDEKTDKKSGITTRSEGRVITLSVDDYLPRHCTNDLSKSTKRCPAHTTVTWDGKYKRNDVPEGLYKLRLTALKALGQAGVAGDEDIYNSPIFRIDRSPLTLPGY